MKKVRYSVIITFSALMAAICILSLFPSKSGFSTFENRKLAAMPQLTLKSVLNGSFALGLENYLLDNFALRNLSIQSYQACTDLFYLDLFRQKEEILMSVNIDSFVAAQKPDGSADYGNGTAGPAGITALPGGRAADSGDRAAGLGGVRAGTGGRKDGPDGRIAGTADRAFGSRSGVAGASGEIGTMQSESAGSGNAAANTGNATADAGNAAAGSGNATGNSGSAEAYPENVATGSQSGTAGIGGNNAYPASFSIERQPGIADGESASPAASNAESDRKQADDRVNDSLIMSSDRIMLPVGTHNLEAFGRILAEIAKVLPGKSVYSITGPTSASFYASKEYSTGPYDQSRAEEIIESAAGGIKVVKAYDLLSEHKNENIYFRSDVHWTALGAYYAYAAFCRSAGIAPASLDGDFTANAYEPFLGGLYSQIYKLPQAARLKENPERLDYYVPKINHKLTLYKMGNLNAPYQVDGIINTNFSELGAYKYSCFAWGDQRIERIDSDAAGGRKLLVVKDSYGSALIPFLVPNYSMIYVIDPKGFNQEGTLSFDAKTLIRDEGIDDVIFCFSIYGSGRSIIQDAIESLFLR